jgi:PAS domain S-box-containing protein
MPMDMPENLINAELRKLHDDMPVGIIIADASNFRIIHANQNACRMLGYTEEELISKPFADLSPPEEQPRGNLNRRRISEDKTYSTRGESVAFARKDGSLIYVDLEGRQINFFNRHCTIVYLWEVTKQKRTADFLRMERDLGIALSAAADLEKAMHNVLDAVCRIDGIDCAGIYLADDSSGDFKLFAHRGVPQEFAEGVAYHKANSLHARTIRAGQVIYNRVNPDPIVGEKDLHQLGIRAVALLPVLFQGQAIGSLDLASRTLDDIPRDISHALEAMVSRLGSVIARLKDREALRESEKKFNAFVRRSPYGYSEIDLEGHILFANDRLAEILGYSIEECIGTHFTKYLDESEIPRAVENLRSVLQQSTSVPREYRFRGKDGGARYIEVSTLPLSKNGQTAGFQCVMLDVTDRRQAQEAIQEEVQRTKTILDVAMDGFNMMDMEGRLQDVNKAFCEICGYSREELLKRSLGDIGILESPMEIRGNLDRARQAGHARFEVQQKYQDGRIIDVEVSLHHCRLGKREFFFSFCRDVTERNRIERTIRDQEAKLRSLFENLPDMVLVVDERGVIQFVNHGTPQAPADCLLGTVGFQYMVPEDQAVCRGALERALAAGVVQTVEVLDSFGLWWACRVVPMTDTEGTRSAIIICTDVTQQKKAAEAIRKEQLLLHQLLELHERDRQLMAYDIHDGFAQEVTGALFNFEAYTQLREKNPEKARKAFDTAMQLLGKSVSEARRLISGLRPPILDEFGIVDAIDYLAHECHKQYKVRVEFHHDMRFSRLAPPLEGAVFRIVQESLTNACRHSQSKKARVELVQRGDRIHVEVRDWGIGFNPDGQESGSFGLRSIRERARLLGGQAVIVTAPNQGTQISVELPAVERAPEVEKGLGDRDEGIGNKG